MADSLRGTHPDAAALQNYADGEPEHDGVMAHVEACAICRDEVAAVQRVTAALSLTSKSPDSLSERIRSRRARADTASAIPLRSRPRARAFLLPVGLAAAAALVIFAPRAVRQDPGDVIPAASGAKGVTPAGAVFETVLSEWSQSSLDSAVRALSADGTTVELRYTTGRDESARAQVLADSIAGFLQREGVAASGITVRRELPQPVPGPVPTGAVGVTVRYRLASPPAP